MVQEKSDFKFHLIHQESFTAVERNLLADFLVKQGRVQGDPFLKLDRCRWICFASLGNKKIAVGAIKLKTTEDFVLAELPELSKMFGWELGYFFTEPTFTGQGVAKKIATVLVNAFGNENLMASTEFDDNPAMDKILVSIGFQRRGKQWKSRITGNSLGLYLKINE